MFRRPQHTQRNHVRGFTLVELLVTLAVIGILSTIIYANFGDSRAQARDNERQSTLKNLELVVERYRNQHGTYPDQGCGSNDSFVTPNNCEDFISGVTPDLVSSLPEDGGYGYRVSANGDRYKIIYDGAEAKLVQSYDDPFARCPRQGGACSGSEPPADVYAVYSLGAEDW